ncbi:MAG TPA: dTMP kinase [Candidatus Portnoybacteria bacterium]|nr:dTMP kinase [Candidatus Portnoybacteria bacterium]
MKQNLFKGLFFVFEGLDGSGQSTQAALLRDYFKAQGKAVILTKEPTNWTVAGRKIKEALDEKKRIEPLKLQELFCEDRGEHLKKEIIPALRAETTVISDRYAFSTMAFGGIEVPMHQLVALNKSFVCPNKVFYLRVRPEECVRRIAARGKGVQFFEKLEKLRKVAKNYDKIAKSFKEIFVMLDGEQGIEKIHQQVIASLK